MHYRALSVLLLDIIINQRLKNEYFFSYTSNIRYKVKDLIGKGYTEIDQNTIWTDNFGHATAEECDMIKDIMNGGVYL